MIWTAWNKGEHHTSGAGYGFKITAVDRDRHFQRQWDGVTVELPQGSGVLAVEVNIAKDSFWGEQCREVIHQEIGRWLRDSGHAPWPRGSPPQFEVEPDGDQRFVVRRCVQPIRPQPTRGRWWKLPVTFVGLLFITVGALGSLVSLAAIDRTPLEVLSIPVQVSWLIAILGGAVGGLARALYFFLVDDYAFEYRLATKRPSPWVMKVYGLEDDETKMEDDFDPLEAWHLYFVKPFVGASLGLLFALALDLGLLGLGGDREANQSPMRLVVAAGLAGLFAETVLPKLQELVGRSGGRA